MAETIQFICNINNRTHETLKALPIDLRWGKCYDSPNVCPVDVPSKEVVTPAFRCSGKRGSASGTEGTATYQMGDDEKAWIKIYFDVTWCWGCSNKMHVEAFDEDIALEVEGFKGDGSVESVTIKVVDGRGQRQAVGAVAEQARH